MLGEQMDAQVMAAAVVSGVPVWAHAVADVHRARYSAYSVLQRSEPLTLMTDCAGITGACRAGDGYATLACSFARRVSLRPVTLTQRRASGAYALT